MLYIFCKAKNETALYEREPKFNHENWEIIDSVKCRKNATAKNKDKVFCPIYQKHSKGYSLDDKLRLWHFPVDEVY